MMVYLFKTILCSAIFLLLYSLFLEKEKMYRFNRFYLLGGIIFSMIIPPITISIGKDTPLYPVTDLVLLPENIVPQVVPFLNPEPVQSYINFEKILLFTYWLVTAFSLVLFIANVYKLYVRIRQRRSIPYKGGRLILLEEELTPHSFLNYIFLNKKDFEEGKIEKEILHHELTHVKQYHTIDVLFMELITAFLWFNPFIFLFKKAVKLNHEFLADESVINQFRNIIAYQSLLLDKTNQLPALTITSQFNFLITKKRLIMITRYTSRRMAILKQFFVLLTMTAAIFIFSSKVILAHEVNKSVQSEKQLIPKYQESNKLQDTTKRSWVGIYAGGTKEGVSQELLNEYHSIIDRNKTPEMTWYVFRQNITATDNKRLEEIFLKMSLAQQQDENVIFLSPSAPLKKIVPTQKQFNSFKNSKVYGLWINEKKVSNSALNKYTAKDISQMFISKLYGAAKKGKIYSYQVDLMTNDYYAKYRADALANNSNYMAFQFMRPSKQK